MKLSEEEKKALRKELAQIVLENERRIIASLKSTESKEMDLEMPFDEVIKRFGRKKRKSSKTQNDEPETKSVHMKEITNEEGKKITVFYSDKNDTVVVSVKIEPDGSIGITLDEDGSVTYSYSSRSTGAIDIATVDQNKVMVYNYGSKRLSGISPLPETSTQIVADKEKYGSSLMQIVYRQILNNTELLKNKKKILEALNDILSFYEESKAVEGSSLQNKVEQATSEQPTEEIGATSQEQTVQEPTKTSEIETTGLEAENERLRARIEKLEEARKRSDAVIKRQGEWIKSAIARLKARGEEPKVDSGSTPNDDDPIEQ